MRRKMEGDPSLSNTSTIVPPCSQEGADDFLSEPSDAVLGSLAGVDGDILVLGAGGKMGLHLSLMLAKAFRRLGSPNRVIAVSRFGAPEKHVPFDRHGIETRSCDLGDAEALRELPEASVVFFLAGIKFGTDTRPEMLDYFNVEVPQKVARRFRGASIVALSTGCVYPFVAIAGPGSSEEDAPAPPGRYAESCLGREQAFSAVSRENGTPTVIIRLNYAVEFRYGVLVDVARQVLHDRPVDVRTGHVNVIWQRDAIDHIIQAASHAQSPPLVLNVTGPCHIAVRTMADRFGVLFNKIPQIEGEEADTAWLSDARRAHRLFGEPRVSWLQMAEWIAGWLASGYPTWDKPTQFENRSGRF